MIIQKPARRGNRPAKSQIAYRLASQDDLVAWMRSLLRQSGPRPVEGPPDGSLDGQIIDLETSEKRARQNALQRLNPDEAQGFVPALFQAWGAVGDILTFYQERLANEGFLRTALDKTSVSALANMVGFSRKPALSASTWLAFTLIDADKKPDSLVLGKGLAVQSVPLPGELPVLFETDQDIEARPAWNALTPWLPPPQLKPQLVGGATQVRVKGSVTGLKPGFPLLLHGTAAIEEGGTLFVRSLTAIEKEPKSGSTVLRWTDPLPGPTGKALINASQVVVFRQESRLFGTTIPDWFKQSPTTQATYGKRLGDVAQDPFARAENAGLPYGEIGALALAAEDVAYCTVGDSLFRLIPGEGWRLAGKAPLHSVFSSLALDDSGRIYGGTERGEVLASNDQGAAWFSLQGPLGLKVGKGESARLPPSKVLAILPIIKTGSIAEIIAGTAVGLWRATVNGSHWRGWNEGLPGYDKTTGGAAVSITAILRDPSHHGHFILATDRGLFTSHGYGRSWHPAKVNLDSHSLLQKIAIDLKDAEKRIESDVVSLKPVKGGLLGLFHGKEPAAAPAQAPDFPLPMAALAAVGPGLFAAFEHGILLGRHGGRLWEPVAAFPAPKVHALAGDGERLLAATDGGLFASSDQGQSWSLLPGVFSGKAVSKVTARDGHLLAAAPFAGYAEPDWTPLSQSGRTLHLDRAYPSLVPGGWLVLSEGLTACRIETVATVPHGDLQVRRVSRVTIAGAIPALPVQTTSLFLGGDAVDLVETPLPVSAFLQGARLKLEGVVEGDLRNKLVAVTGRQATARFLAQPGGVRCWDGAAKLWKQVGSGNPSARCLLSMKGELFLGSQYNVYRLEYDEWHPIGYLDRPSNVLLATDDGGLLSGSDGGLWYHRGIQTGGGEAWTPLGLNEAMVSALALSPDGKTLWVGTDKGLWSRSIEGLATVADWTAETATAGAHITGLAATPSGLAATCADGRVFLYGQGQWYGVGGPPAQSISCLVPASGGGLLAGTNCGLFISSDQGSSWSRPSMATGEDDIRAVLVGPEGELWGAVHGVGVTTDGRLLRAGIANEARALALHGGKLYAGFLFGSTLLPIDPADDGAWIEPSFLCNISDFDLEAELADGLASPNLRRVLASYEIDLPAGAVVSGLFDGNSWRIGEPDSAIAWLVSRVSASKEQVPTWHLFKAAALVLTDAPEPLADEPGFCRWHLLSRDGVGVSLIAAEGELDFGEASGKSDPVAEVRRVVNMEVSADHSSTLLELESALDNVYDAKTTTILGNVAPASHGETPVLYEAVGSGDASRANQSFTLRRGPLTARPDDDQPFYRFDISLRVRSGGMVEPLSANSKLMRRQVEQESIEWRQVESLSNSGPADEHYTIHLDDDGQAVVTFGDGVNGKRLPTAPENVIAHYRTGSGPSGNVLANRLTLMVRRPPGVRKVTNPLAASGGAMGDDAEKIRLLAPKYLSASERLVSEEDFVSFVRSWPGIAKAVVRRFKPLHGLIHVTVADGTDALGEGGNFRALQQVMQANCAIRHPIRIDRCKPRWFNLEAGIIVLPGHDEDEVLGEVQEMLQQAYGFASRDLAQPVRLAEVTSRMQRVPGVKAVQVTAFFRKGENASIQREILASPASLTADGDLVPAELLLINPHCSSGTEEGTAISLMIS